MMKNQFPRSSLLRCRSQSGFSLVTTIFIIVVLAVLGTYMSLMSTTQNQSTALSIQGQRAWYAAVSGFEWVAFQLNPATGSGNCPSIPTTMTIEGFTVRVTDCTPYSITEAGGSYTLHDVTVTSERGSFGDVDYVSRSLRATVGGS